MTAQPKIAAEMNAAGPFVVNLCASTTPMALAQPQAPELKRFSFFVSRRREEGRERFRLHMGYFMTLAEAEEWLNVVRDIYPGAWAGEAPGKRLAQRAAAATAPEVPPAPAVVIASATVPQPAVMPTAPLLPVVPTLHAAPKVAATPKITAASPAAAVPKAAMAAKPAAPTAVKPPAPKAKAPPLAAAVKAPPAGSNVREVLKLLDETGETRLMPSPVRGPSPAPAPTAAALSDSQVLKILESRRADDQPRGKDEANNSIALLRPDDTATVRALKEAVRDNASVSFAVQLQWSVQPIDLAKMPPLAIFSAYTLYTVEGSRDGRKWYGLRLGFFSDAISAKQVASYVRSEFTSVAVIPVSLQELGRATDGDNKAPGSSAARPPKAPEQRVDEFKLIDDQTDDVGMPGLAAAQAQLQAKKSAATPIKTNARSAGHKSSKKSGGRVRATEKRSPKTLEETLEILGASELQIDNGRGEFLNDSGVRHLRVEVQKNSPFTKLLERLSERVRKP